MKKSIKPEWSGAQAAAAERSFRQWDAFFAARDGAAAAAPAVASVQGAGTARIAEVQAKHEAALMRYPNVVAVAPGIRTRAGKPTGEACLVVYVDRKVPAKRLGAAARLPRSLDGVPVDVVAVGAIETQPA